MKRLLFALIICLSVVASVQAVSDAERRLVLRRVRLRLKASAIRYDELDVGPDGLCALDLTRSGIRSLEPLRGLPLCSLRVAFADVADLRPLRGMQLRSLTMWGTAVKDLSPLQGLPLKELNLHHSRDLVDLGPLKGMRLQRLYLGWTSVADLSPLEGMELVDFACGMTPVTDLSPLAGMPLESLSFTPERITGGLEAVRQLATLKRIEREGSEGPWEVGYLPAREFWNTLDTGNALERAGIEYRKLRVDEKGMVTVDVSSTAISDLGGLKGLKLVWIDLGATPMKSLAPLEGMPLAYISILDTGVTDLSPLGDSPLKEIRFDPAVVEKGLDAIRTLKSLQRIGVSRRSSVPPHEFWRRYDAGEYRRR